MAQVTAYVNETLQQGSRLRPYGEQIGQRVGMMRFCVIELHLLK
jgi:hypothetical protein